MKVKLSVKETVLFSMLGALMYASKLLMELFPNIHLLGVFIVAITVVYRKKALYPIYTFVFISGMFAGFSVWWIPYLYIWTVLWAATMLLPKRLPKKIAPVIYMTVSALHGFLYGTLYAPTQALLFGMSFKETIAWIVTGLPWDFIHGVSNFICGILICPIILLLKNADKYSGKKRAARPYAKKDGFWEGKTFVSLGDSITYQDGKPYFQGENTGSIARGYQTILSEGLKFASYLNVGVSGRPMANGSVNGDGTVITAQSVKYREFDLCIIAVGTNDFRLNIPLGEYSSDKNYDITTFYGAYQATLDYILKENQIQICLFTPLQRDNSGYSVSSVNTAGKSLPDYISAIKDLGEKYSLSVCDMFAGCGIDMSNLREYTIDGLHPNDKGYEKMGAFALEFISKLGQANFSNCD